MSDLAQQQAADRETALVRQPEYLRVLGIAGLLGVPVSLVAFGFLAVLHEAEHRLWHDLPHALTGRDLPPWWWPLPLLALAGLGVGAVARWAPGHGGHTPADGMGGAPPRPSELPWVLVAALISLPLGAVLGPEAPLIAGGGGLALLAAHVFGVEPGSRPAMIVSGAGAAAAIAAIFGSPVVAAVLLIEMVQLSGAALSAVVIPCLLAAGVGSIVFTGVGLWSGLPIGSLNLPIPAVPVRPDLGDLLWALPLAVVAAIGIRLVRGLAKHLAPRVTARPLELTVLAALGVGACAAAYALITGRSPAEVALSGQQTLAAMAADPTAWPETALLALVLFKGLGYALSLAALRGGPIFPAVTLGGVLGVLAGPLPGFGAVPAMAAGMAAATVAMLPLPVSAVVLVVLLLGPAGFSMTPVVLIATVVAFLTEHLVEHGLARRARQP
ncbi:chloride channel protein [Catellatospora sichuanensis]|uniref:chloride channel protein n=1 Tax=Catellatospora sichuanensis TaxID=1969805 RepID=UPI001182AD5C|nr:chloride channel protein [Catellatospora sichuanensis]